MDQCVRTEQNDQSRYAGVRESLKSSEYRGALLKFSLFNNASLKATCRKLNISFWDYLTDRISCSDPIPLLHHLLEQRIALSA